MLREEHRQAFRLAEIADFDPSRINDVIREERGDHYETHFEGDVRSLARNFCRMGRDEAEEFMS